MKLGCNTAAPSFVPGRWDPCSKAKKQRFAAQTAGLFRLCGFKAVRLNMHPLNLLL